ncbi:PH domain-containing protein [Streptomyces tendae]|uniref:PH domain-containing protein n=1 Tax=Streptomyces tendae TaxID=1932 RepID=UPI0036867887
METGSPDDTGTAGATQAADRAGPPDQAGPVLPAGPAGPADPAREEPVWTGLPPGLLRMRRLLLVVWLGLLTLAAGVLPALFLAPLWAALALLPLALLAWGWVMLGRNWRSWRYAERADDLLISRGVLWQEETVVPYGRMQLVEVTSGPVERHFGLASVQLHTAAAATDATIPGLDPAEAERLRDRLTELGEARSAGL